MATGHILIPVVILTSALTAAAQETTSLERHTPNTFKESADTKSPRATLEEMRWFAGHWTGPGLGGFTEETWTAPAAGAMLGTFRLIKDGKPVFYEFLTLVEHEGSLLLRLKHFNPDLTGWEEKDKSINFRLLKIGPDEIAFDGLTFRREGADKLRIFLAIRSRTDGAVREEVFEMRRTSSSS
jgi:Domain of unknown function (DUF6265)